VLSYNIPLFPFLKLLELTAPEELRSLYFSIALSSPDQTILTFTIKFTLANIEIVLNHLAK